MHDWLVLYLDFFFKIKIYPLVEHLVWIVAVTVVDFGICLFCLLVTHWKTFPLSHEAEDQASFTEENDKDESPLLNQVQGFAHVKLNRNWSIARVSLVSHSAAVLNLTINAVTCITTLGLLRSSRTENCSDQWRRQMVRHSSLFG